MPHTFPLRLSWGGSTASPDYPRDLTASTPGKVDLAVSSAGPYGGDPGRWNPEDLFGASLATCHTLTFLSLASKFRVDVRRVEVEVQVTLDTVERVTRITEVELRPTITVTGDAGKVAEAWEKAHKYCFVANSVTARVSMPAPVVVAG